MGREHDIQIILTLFPPRNNLPSLWLNISFSVTKIYLGARSKEADRPAEKDLELNQLWIYIPPSHNNESFPLMTTKITSNILINQRF